MHFWFGASLVAQMVKNLPAMRETWVQSLGLKDLLERERLCSPVFWPGKFYGLYSPWCRKESDTTEQLLLTGLDVLFAAFDASLLFVYFYLAICPNNQNQIMY